VTATVLTLPEETAVTVSVPAAPTTTSAQMATLLQSIQAGLSDPSQVPAVRDAKVRAQLTAELRDLDSFLAGRPKLQPYRTHIWFVAHHARPPVYARRVAALLWCTVWFPRDCG
jgi:hypothetical protein